MKQILIPVVLFAMAAVGCGPGGSSDRPDYIHAVAHLFDDNGQPASNFAVREYTVTMNFRDGSGITDGFDVSTINSDSNGDLNFVTEQLGLSAYSGSTSDCYSTCVDYDPYGYCWSYAYDCYNSDLYVLYDVTEIASTSAQVAFDVGNNHIVTNGVQLSGHVEDSGRTTWYEEDNFFLPVVFATGGQPALSSKATAGKDYQTNYKPAVYKGEALKTLSPAQKALVLKARAHILDKSTGKPLAADAFKIQL